MKSIFIAGPREIRKLDNKVLLILKSFEEKSFRINVGDANGVDKLIQTFYHNLNYDNVFVFASNGKARNNLGNWEVIKVEVDKSVKGFEFYVQKNKAMAEKCDLGLMIWNGKSKGTLNNIINLRKKNKPIVLFLTTSKEFFQINSDCDFLNIIKMCPDETKQLYIDLLNKDLDKTEEKKNDEVKQLSMIIQANKIKAREQSHKSAGENKS